MSAATRPEIDRETFERLAEKHRKELQLHCYRMLGSVHDAEDATQEALLRAWRGLGGYQGRASFRSWLYRIATNACLTSLTRRPHERRLLPEMAGPPAEFAPLGDPERDAAWLEPYPDAALQGLADAAPGPEARYELHESVRLAFIAALQRLPAKQRAVLLLRDVLGFSAAEAAAALETSVTSANSALQRARTTFKGRSAITRERGGIADDRLRALLDRYVHAWEKRDVDGFVALLREDAVWSMPPWRQWYVGRAQISAFIGWAWRSGRRQLLVPTAANAQPAFAYYRSDAEGAGWVAFAIQVLSPRGREIAAITSFVDPRLFAVFGLSSTLPPNFRPDR